MFICVYVGRTFVEDYWKQAHCEYYLYKDMFEICYENCYMNGIMKCYFIWMNEDLFC